MVERPRVLLIDIETAPKIAYVWRTYDESISPEQLVSDTFLLSFAAKWLGEKKVIYSDQSTSRPMSNDMKLLRQIHSLMDEADIVVAHNGQAFDVPFVLTRMVAKGLPPMSPFKQVDTFRIARRQFGFTFNRLVFLAKALDCRYLKDEHPEYPGITLWKECLRRNPDAWRVMRRYNIGDVQTLEEVYMKLRPWVEKHPNAGIWIDDGNRHCPVCGSTEMQIRGYKHTDTGIYTQYRCNACGKYARGRQTVNTREHRRLQLLS